LNPPAAIEKLTVQAVLAKIAIEGSDIAVRIAAIARITDQEVLIWFGRWGPSKRLAPQWADKARLTPRTPQPFLRACRR
jgi:hypothetical protein